MFGPVGLGPGEGCTSLSPRMQVHPGRSKAIFYREEGKGGQWRDGALEGKPAS